MSTVTFAAPDDITVELVRQGLPVDYAERAAAELVDHHRDLIHEFRARGFDEAAAKVEATKRLGDKHILVKKTVREYQRRFWCGRWPLLTFLIAPIPLLLLAFTATLLTAGCLEWSFYHFGLMEKYATDGVISTNEYALNIALRAMFMFVLPAAVLCGLFGLAKRAAMNWRWIGVTACVLALAVSSARWGFTDPVLHHQKFGFNGKPMPPDHIGLSIGMFWLNVPSRAARIWYRDVLDQTLFPLGIAALLLLRMKQVSRHAERLAFDDC